MQGGRERYHRETAPNGYVAGICPTLSLSRNRQSWSTHPRPTHPGHLSTSWWRRRRRQAVGPPHSMTAPGSSTMTMADGLRFPPVHEIQAGRMKGPRLHLQGTHLDRLLRPRRYGFANVTSGPGTITSRITLPYPTCQGPGIRPGTSITVCPSPAVSRATNSDSGSPHSLPGPRSTRL